MPPQKITALIGQARMKLGWTQRQLGENLDSSHRTATRWEARALDVAPKVVRPSVLLTLQRALDVGLGLNAAHPAGLLAPARDATTTQA